MGATETPDGSVTSANAASKNAASKNAATNMTAATSTSTPTRLSYTSGTSDVPLLGDTIGANLDRMAARFGAHEALVEYATGRRWTYREFVADVDAIALGLLDAGLGKGDRVGIWAPNRAEWTLVQYATARIGAIL